MNQQDLLCIQFGNKVKENNRPTLKANSCKLISISSYMFLAQIQDWESQRAPVRTTFRPNSGDMLRCSEQHL